MRLNKKLLLPSVALVVCLLDQATKIYMSRTLEIGQNIEVIPDLFNLTLVMNPGAAFGLFANLPPTMRRILLGLVTITAMGLVFVLLRHEARGDNLSSFALYMVIGGAIGNLIDRFRYDAVVDFLDFYWGSYHWPAFNVADSAISVAVFILILRSTIFPKKSSEIS